MPKNFKFYKILNFVKCYFPFFLLIFSIFIDINLNNIFIYCDINLTMQVIYYLTIYYPKFFPIIILFIIGIIKDNYDLVFLGQNSFIYLIMYLILLPQRKYFINNNFAIIWLGFVFFAFIYLIIKLLIILIIYNNFVFNIVYLKNYLIMIIIYPILIKGIIKLRKVLGLYL